jgi:hypothetical protein
MAGSIFDAIQQSRVAQEQSSNAARMGMRAALPQPPAAADVARTTRLSQELGIDPLIVSADPDRFEQIYNERRAQTTLANAPATTRFMMENPGVQLGVDDTEQIAAIEAAGRRTQTRADAEETVGGLADLRRRGMLGVLGNLFVAPFEAMGLQRPAAEQEAMGQERADTGMQQFSALISDLAASQGPEAARTIAQALIGEFDDSAADGSLPLGDLETVLEEVLSASADPTETTGDLTTRAESELLGLFAMLDQGPDPEQRAQIEAEITRVMGELDEVAALRDFLPQLAGRLDVTLGDAPAPIYGPGQSMLVEGTRALLDMGIMGVEAIDTLQASVRAAVSLEPTEFDDYRIADLTTEVLRVGLERLLPPDQARQLDFATTLAQGGGSLLGFYGFAAARVPVWAAGAAVGGAAQLRDAEEYNATAGQRLLSFYLGAGLGSSEAIPIDRALNRVAAGVGREVMSDLLVATTASTLEEFFQELVQSAGADVISSYLAPYNPDRLQPMDWFEQAMVGGITGGVAGAALSGGSALSSLVPQRQPQQPPTQEFLDRFEQAVREAELGRRAPGAMEDALRAIVPDQQLYVAPEGLQELFQSGEASLPDLGITAEQFDDSLTTGTAIPIDLAAYGARMIDTPLGNWVRANGSLSENELSVAEIQAIQAERQGDVDPALAAVEAELETFRLQLEDSQRIYDATYQQLRAAGQSRGVAARNAELTQAFWRTKAEEFGVAASGLAARFGGLRIEGAQSPAPAGTTLQQAAEIVRRTPEFEAWFGDSAVQEETGEPLVVYRGLTQPFEDGRQGLQFFGDTETASDYAEEFAAEGDQPNVVPAYLKIERPATDTDVLRAAGVPEADWDTVPTFEYLTQEIADQLRAEGFDGVIMTDASPSRPGEMVQSYAVFDPAQIKSIFNERPTSDPRILYQDARQTSQQGEVTGVPLATRLSEAFRMAQTRRYRTGRELKLDLQEVSLAAQADAGIDLTTLDEENIDRLADFVVEDALEALQDNVNAIGWYDRTITAALEEVAVLHPEILTDQARRLQFTWALAVTSNGLKVDKNFEVALQAYEALLASEDQRFPAKIGIGTAAGQIDGGLAMYGRMLERFDGDHEALADFMNAQVPVRDLERDFDVKISGEGKGELVRGASILGPKIGNGFFANLYGNFDALTMDRWLMRTVGRWRGTLININEGMIDQKRGEIRELIDGLSQPERRALSGMLPDGVSLRARMSTAQLDALGVAVQKESMVPAWRTEVNGMPGGENLRKLGNALAKYLDGQVEAPAGAQERAFLRKVFTRGLARLQETAEVRQASNQELTMSDLQALLWYPEKRLYDTAKQIEGESRGYADDDAPDYANAARAVVRDRLGQGGRTGRAGGRPADDGRGVGADTAVADPVQQGRAGRGGDTREPAADGVVVVEPRGNEGRPQPVDGEAFSAAMEAAGQALGPIAAQVSTVDPSRDVQRFMLDDGLTGYALDGDNIIGVFKHPDAPRGAAQRVMADAVARGARRLDGFNTMLPRTYARGGFRAVARLAFDPQYAPARPDALADWDAEAMEAMQAGWGTPDVFFMVYDPANASAETDNVVATYEDGITAQDEALGEIDALPQERTYNQDQTGDSTPRGSITFGDDEVVIRLFKAADLSTFIHESGHYFLEMSRQLAELPDAPQRAKDDMAKIHEFLGSKPGKPFTRAQHEKWARGFEAYAMEGNAPSIALADAFSSFKAWLLRIYQSALRLNVRLTPEIRGVMDRMLATDQELAEVREAQQMTALFSEKPDGMSDAAWDRYQRLTRHSAQASEQTLLKKTMAAIQRGREAWYNEELRNEMTVVAEDVNAEPRYRLIEALGNQRRLEGGEVVPVDTLRLDKQELVDTFGPDILSQLSRSKIGGQRPLWQETGGVGIDEVAEVYGFKNGQAMIDALRKTPKRLRRIREIAQERLTAKYGDPLNDGTLEEEALAALHNDQQAAQTIAELKFLTERQRGSTQGLTARVYKYRAQQMLQRMNVKEASKPQSFLAAERRAAAKAMAALERGNDAEARQAKEQQLLNHYLYQEAVQIRDMVEKGREKMMRYRKRTIREKIEATHLDQIDQLLDRFDFRRRSEGQLQNAESLVDFHMRMIAEGREGELAISEEILRQAERKHYSRLSVSELQGLFDTIQNLDTMGRRHQDLVDARGRRSLRESAQKLAERIRTNLGTGKTKQESGTRSFFNLLFSMDTMLIEIDGGDEVGVAYEELKSAIDTGMAEEQRMNVEMAGGLEQLFSVYTRNDLDNLHKRKAVAGANGRPWAKAEILSVALNTGNADNLNRLLDPAAHEENRLTKQQMDALLATLDKRDWEFVQSVWDYVDSFWTRVAEVEERRTGIRPKKVEAKPVETRFGVYRGGYYPIKYDPGLSVNANLDAETGWDQFRSAGRFGKAHTANGHLQARKKGSNGRTLQLDLQPMFGHLRDVVRGITLSEAVDNTYRLLNHPTVRSAFMDAGRLNDLNTMNLWLADVGRGPVYNTDAVNTFFRTMKNNFTLSRLAFNFKTVALQVTGLGQSAATVGKVPLMRAFNEYRKRPLEVTQEIVAKSAFMAERQTSFQKDIYDFANETRISGPVLSQEAAGKGGIARVMNSDVMRAAARGRNSLAQAGFWPMIRVQFHVVDVPTWIAGYDEGMKKFDGDEDKAIQYADRMVARAQGSGLMADRSGFERGTLSKDVRQADFVRFFTTLQSYMIAKLNRGVVTTRRGVRDIREADGVAATAAAATNMAADLMLLYVFEAAFMALAYALMTDDEDDEDIRNFMLTELGSAVIGGVPFARDAYGAFLGYGGGGIYGSVLDVPASIAVQVGQGETDRAFWRSLTQGMGVLTGLPTTAGQRAIEGALSATGRTQEETPISEAIFGYNPLAN